MREPRASRASLGHAVQVEHVKKCAYRLVSGLDRWVRLELGLSSHLLVLEELRLNGVGVCDLLRRQLARHDVRQRPPATGRLETCACTRQRVWVSPHRDERKKITREQPNVPKRGKRTQRLTNATRTHTTQRLTNVNECRTAGCSSRRFMDPAAVPPPDDLSRPVPLCCQVPPCAVARRRGCVRRPRRRREMREAARAVRGRR